MKISKTSEICKLHISQNKIYIHVSLLHVSYVNSVVRKTSLKISKGEVIRSQGGQTTQWPKEKGPKKPTKHYREN
jgi:hypothetical protein